MIPGEDREGFYDYPERSLGGGYSDVKELQVGIMQSVTVRIGPL